MGICGSANWWVKVALLVILLGLIFEIVGFATVSWMYYAVNSASIRIGLWKTQVCNSAGTCSEDSTSTSYKNDSFRATQVMEIFALVLFLILPIVIAVYVFAASTRVWKFAVACMVLCFLAALFITIGMIIWLTYVYNPFIASYSMGFTVMAGILALIAMLLFIPELDDDPRFWWSRRYSDNEDALYSPRSNRGYYTSEPRTSSTVVFSRARTTPLNDQSIYLPPSRRSALALPPPDSSRTKYNPIYETSGPPKAARHPSPTPQRSGSAVPRTSKVSPTPPVTPSDVNTSNLRAPTYNNVSDVVLQRDRVFR